MTRAPDLTTSGPSWRHLDVWLRAAAVGVAAGFLSGLFGVGGGILLVPALVLVLGFDQRRAHGTSLAAIVPIVCTGLVGYELDGNVDWAVAAPLIAGALVGAVLGTRLLQTLPQRALGFLFVVVLLLTAIRMLLDHSSASGRGDVVLPMLIALVAIGIASGILAGLLGVGGGIVLVPAMVVLFHIPAVVAKGTSLAVIIPASVMGTWRNLKRDNADLKLAMMLGIAGAASAFAGAEIAGNMGETTSNILFACLLLFVALRMVFQLQRERREAKVTIASPRTGGQRPTA